MTEIAVLCASQEERDCIREALAELAIRYDWADSTVRFFPGPEAIEGREGIENPRMFLYDAGLPGARRAMVGLRAAFPDALMIPIADARISPTDYVRPEIMPFGLLWRPLTREGVVRPLCDAFVRLREQEAPSEDCFLMKSRTGIQRIPYMRICYFEAAEKKLLLRTPETEFVFAGTLSALEPQLPEQFIRCHKSFIVSRDHIRDIRYDVQSVRLDGALEIPYSRGYRKTFLEKFYGRNA